MIFSNKIWLYWIFSYIFTQNFSSQDQYSLKMTTIIQISEKTRYFTTRLQFEMMTMQFSPQKIATFFISFFFLSYVAHPKHVLLLVTACWYVKWVWILCLIFSVFLFHKACKSTDKTRSCINIDGSYFNLMDSTSYKDRGYGLP